MPGPAAGRPTASGSPILLLHGLLSNGSVWNGVRTALAGEGLDVISPDLLGYRSAPRPSAPYTLEAVTEALVELVEREGPRTVIGHSMGGIIALELARRLPDHVDRVGLIGLPVFRDRGDGLDYLDRRGPFYRVMARWDGFAHVGCRAMHSTRRAWLPLAPLVVPRQPREVIEAAFDHCDQTHSGCMSGIIFGNHVDRLAAEVRAPVAAYHGTNDTAAPPQRVQALAAERGWDFTLVEGGGHQLQIERPADVARWIATLPGRTSPRNPLTTTAP